MAAEATGSGSGTVAAAAARLAASRRSLISLMSGPMSRTIALDLMSLRPQDVTAQHLVYADLIARTEVQTLRSAELFLADDSMCTLLDTAARTMPDQVLREDDPLTPTGLVAFFTPIQDRTGQGIALPLRAMSWRTLPAGHPILEPADVGTSVLLTFYIASADYADAVGQTLQPNAPRWLPNSTVVWAVGTEIGVAFGKDSDEQQGAPGFYQQLAAAFWTLLKQPRLVARADHEPAKPERRRYARAGIERPNEPVRIIRLNRPSEGPVGRQGSRPINWQHSWIVRGYWRRTWLPSKQTHRQQYIAAFRKGPADKPLLGGEKVFLAAAPPPNSPPGDA